MSDIHTEPAKKLTGKKKLTKEERLIAKSINFCALYGLSSYRMKHNIETQQGGPKNGNKTDM